MKFINGKDAPDIPLKLLEAQEAGQLVFFCGAGISCQAGLPVFSELVKGIYDDLSVDIEKQEQEAIDRGAYDEALYFLEKRLVEHAVRRVIIERLTFNTVPDLSTHKAILELAKINQHGHRLVTTNVDHGFKLALPNIKCHAAPHLPTAKPHTWQSTVYLHGLIDHVDDPNGEELIFTSGDFGKAYALDGWASKFFRELCCHFTVLFVGYSVNDPLLDYLLKAIKNERSKGDKDYFQPYVFAQALPDDTDKERALWETKGIEPIFYFNDHSNLHKTLMVWSEYCRDGLNGKAKIIRVEACKPPLLPYEEDDAIQRVINVLKERTNVNDSSITGFPARIFKEIKAPIEWLFWSSKSRHIFKENFIFKLHWTHIS